MPPSPVSRSVRTPALVTGPVDAPPAGPAGPAEVPAGGRAGLTAGCWVVEGPLDPGTLRVRIAGGGLDVPLTVLGPGSVGTDRAEWGELIREEAAAAEAEPGPARVLLARLGAERSLLVVVTEDALPPAAVMRWLLTDEAPFPAAVGARSEGLSRSAVGPEDGQAGAAERGPSGLPDGGDRASGYARTVRVPAGRAAARLPLRRGARGDVAGRGPGGAAGALRWLAGYGDRRRVRRARGGHPRVAESASGTVALRAGGHALASGVPVHPGFHAALAVAPCGVTEPERAGACTASAVRPPDAVAHHGLLVLLEDDQVRMDYDTGLYEDDAVATFAARLLAVLEQLLDDRPVYGIVGAGAAERAALAEWSRGAEGAVPAVCLHTLVEEHAVRTPDAPAVLCGETELTYRRLDEDANRVARLLRAAGVGPGGLVALLTERAAWSVTAMLGVLKAGAAYVPVEPTYPPERVRRILDDSGAVVLLAGQEPEYAVPVPVLLGDEAAGLPGTPLGVPVAPDDLAYVIYTSGSTGTPKGIGVHHRAIVASTAARAVAGPPPGRDLVLPPLCFDGAAGGMFWALTSRGRGGAAHRAGGARPDGAAEAAGVRGRHPCPRRALALPDRAPGRGPGGARAAFDGRRGRGAARPGDRRRASATVPAGAAVQRLRADRVRGVGHHAPLRSGGGGPARASRSGVRCPGTRRTCSTAGCGRSRRGAGRDLARGPGWPVAITAVRR